MYKYFFPYNCNIPLHSIFFRPIITDNSHNVCSALKDLIQNCTQILGWCFSSQQVQSTIQKQRDIAMSTLASMNILCSENFILDDHEDIFAENVVLTNETAKTVQVLPQINSFGSGSSKLYSFTSVVSMSALLLTFIFT